MRWMVRTSKNRIEGPFEQSKICELIENGTLTFQDEVCPSGGYWFFLHETEELSKQLGVTVPKRKVANMEITSTETEKSLSGVDHERTDPDILPIGGLTPASKSKEGASQGANSGHEEVPIETPALYKLALWGLVGAALGVIWALIKILQYNLR